MCEWFTASSSCLLSHNHPTWHSGCIGLTGCEWFTARTSCVSSHNLSTWHFGCIDLTGCEWCTATSCVPSLNLSIWHSGGIDLTECKWFTARSNCVSSPNSSTWHSVVLTCQCVSDPPVLAGPSVSFLIILLLGTLVVLAWQDVSDSLPSPAVSFLMILLPITLLYCLVRVWVIHCQFTCVSSHNPFIWHSGCIDLTACEWFTARASCISSHNSSTWHSGCIDSIGCENFTTRFNCISYNYFLLTYPYWLQDSVWVGLHCVIF